MSSRARVVIDARYLRGAPGGVATYTAALVERLPAMLPDVPFVLLRHPAAPAALSRALNVDEWVVGGRPNGPWTYLAMGAWLRRRLGPEDLFHAPYRILPRDPPPRSVLTMHDVMQVVCPELVFPSPLSRPALAAYWSWTVRSSIRSAATILAVSRHSAEDTMRLDPTAAPRIRVTPLGVHARFAPMASAEALRASDSVVQGDRRFFLLLGGGYPNRNHVAGLAAFARAFTPSDGVYLCVVQRERTRSSELHRELCRAGLQARVLVRGSVSDEQLRGLYARAEALVFPSLYEGFGLPVLEAMACGCPVVASSRTSVPEVAGDAALLCDPSDLDALARHMRSIADEASVRARLRAAGLARAASYTWDETARATVEAYREIAPWIPPCAAVC